MSDYREMRGNRGERGVTQLPSRCQNEDVAVQGLHHNPYREAADYPNYTNSTTYIQH